MANINLTFEQYQNNSNLPVIPANRTTGNVNVTMPLSKLELARHGMCLGYMDLREFASRKIGRHISRFCQILADVDVRRADNSLTLSQDYMDCDPSEKRYGSYTLGESLTRAVANRYFDINWVCHFDTLEKRHGYKKVKSTMAKPNANPSAGGSTPDLVGYDSQGRAHLFEAKGTMSAKVANNEVQKAINQVSGYEGVEHDGQIDRFVTRNACCFSFKDGFAGRIIDPYSEGSTPDSLGLYGCLFDAYALYCAFFENEESTPIRVDSAEFLAWKIIGHDRKEYLFGIDVDYVQFASEMRFGEYAKRLSKRSRNETHQMVNDDQSSDYQRLAKQFVEYASSKKKHYESYKVSEQIADYRGFRDSSIGTDGFLVAECL